MNETKRYFEKAHIIFKLLKDGNVASIDTIKTELNVSRRTAIAAINEFNTFENTIIFLENEYVMFSEKKESLTDCKTYKVYSELIKRFTSDPEHYFSGNEIEISKELGIDRTILQKIKTLVKMNS